MRTEPHKSITKARVDYRYGDAAALTKLTADFAHLSLQVHSIPLPTVLAKTLPHCDAVEYGYFEHNLSETTTDTLCLAVTWLEGDEQRVETSIAIAPADDASYRDNTRFQCAQELLERYRALLTQALAIQASQPVEAEYVDVVRD